MYLGLQNYHARESFRQIEAIPKCNHHVAILQPRKSHWFSSSSRSFQGSVYCSWFSPCLTIIIVFHTMTSCATICIITQIPLSGRRSAFVLRTHSKLPPPREFLFSRGDHVFDLGITHRSHHYF